ARGHAGAVVVVEELDVAAERDPGEAPARAVLVGEAEDLAAEADGEIPHPDAAPARDQEMAELVNDDDRGEHEEEHNRVDCDVVQSSNPLIDKSHVCLHSPTLPARRLIWLLV